MFFFWRKKKCGQPWKRKLTRQRQSDGTSVRNKWNNNKDKLTKTCQIPLIFDANISAWTCHRCMLSVCAEFSIFSTLKVLLTVKDREIYCLIFCFILFILRYIVLINSHSFTKKKTIEEARKSNLGRILEHFPQAGMTEWPQRSSSDAVHFLARTNQTDDFIPTAACATSVWAAPRSLACSAECECFKVGGSKKGCLRWTMCWEESVLMNHVSVTGCPADGLKQAPTERRRCWWRVGAGRRQA